VPLLLPYVGAAPVPRVQQQTRYTCGPACLRAVIGHWTGRNVPEEKLASVAHANPTHGTSEADLVQAARAIGFEAYSQLFATPEELRGYTRRGAPVICVVESWNVPNAHHWIVVEAVEDDEDDGTPTVQVMDPHPPTGRGNRRSLRQADFTPRWWHWEGAWFWRRKVPGLGVVVMPKGVTI
jgi:predicted double-glycine peptidase